MYALGLNNVAQRAAGRLSDRRSKHRRWPTPIEHPLPVLVLEHDTAIRRFVAAVLRLGGHEVVEFALAGEASDWLVANGVGAVVCDHNPPDMAGAAFVRVLRS